MEVDVWIPNAIYKSMTYSVLSFRMQCNKNLVKLVVATGKAPGGEWVKKTIPRLGPSPQPGVFMQGLCVFGKDGSMIFTRELERDVIKDVIDFGKQYSELEIYSSKQYPIHKKLWKNINDGPVWISKKKSPCKMPTTLFQHCNIEVK